MSVVDEIKRRLDLVQVVSESVALDTRSRTPKALCPFHAERTPSFVVFPDSQSWRCFGQCATGGDAISFIMKRDNLSFGDALREAARRAGVELSHASDEHAARVSPLVAANESALLYFWSVLKSPAGEAARAYLESRGISMDAASRRDIGLAPSGLETLAGHLKSSGTSGAAAKGAGLVTQSRDGDWRDMFRGRLMIAIRDADGRVVGFGGRSLDGSEPKYLNTPRTEIFDKSTLLYGLNWAAPDIRQSGVAVVVEGYMDAITAHEHGFRNVVASMGTAITREQVAHVRGLAKTVVLALDADAAGQEATLNSLETVWNADPAGPGRGRDRGIEIKVARLSGGKDPDEMIRHAPSEWRAAVDQAAPLVEWLIETYAVRLDLNDPAGKEQFTQRTYALITPVDNPYQQDRYLTAAAQHLGVTAEQYKINAERLRGRKPARARHHNAGNRGAPSSEPIAPQSETATEDRLLALILEFSELAEYAADVPEDLFTNLENRALFETWKCSGKMTDWEQALDPHLLERVRQLRTAGFPRADHRTRVAEVSECVRRLHERHLRGLKAEEERVLAELDAGHLPRETEAAIQQQSLEHNERLRQIFSRLH